MSDTSKVYNVNRNFNLSCLVELLDKKYKEMGFEVTPIKNGNNYMVTFSKDESGIKKFVGLGQQITANFMMSSPDTLVVTFTDAEWTGKIIGFVIGCFLCFIPFFIAIYGSVRQSKMPNEIGQNIQMLIPGAERTAPSGQRRPLNANPTPKATADTYSQSPYSGESVRYCPNCGNQLKPQAKFCGKCGTKM